MFPRRTGPRITSEGYQPDALCVVWLQARLEHFVCKVDPEEADLRIARAPSNFNHYGRQGRHRRKSILNATFVS